MSASEVTGSTVEAVGSRNTAGFGIPFVVLVLIIGIIVMYFQSRKNRP